MLIDMFRFYKTREDGTTAIEFSLLVMPFLLTIFCIIELAVYFAYNMILQGAVQDASRLIRTGQLQQMSEADDALAAFLDAVCDGAFLMDCDAFEYQVEQLDDFDDADIAPSIDDDGVMDPPSQFNIGDVTAGCVALVRVTYPYQFITPFFADVWSDYPNNVKLLVSTVVFQVEPYDFEVDDPNCSV